MKILLLNNGSKSQCLMSTGIIKSLSNQLQCNNFTVITKFSNTDIYKYNKNIKKIYIQQQILSKVPSELFNQKFDILINLNQYGDIHKYFAQKIQNKIGFGFTNGSQNYLIKKTNKNMFQSYYSVIGLKWRGESYDFNYKPKTKQKLKTGIAISNINLKNYIIQKMKLQNLRLWNIPIKNDIRKQYDQINVCNRIITDNSLIMHISSDLRKQIHFLKTSNINYQIQLFNKGNVIEIPSYIVN